MSSRKRFWLIMGGAGTVVAVAAGVAAFLILGVRDEQLPAGGEAAAKAVEKRVSRHYLLPSDEKPALATITDKDKLTSPTFKMAENGDRILIYQNNRLAIVYRPSKDRIVAVVPVSIDEPTNITKQDGR